MIFLEKRDRRLMGLSSILSQLARMSLAGLRLHPPLLLFDVSFDFPF